MAVVKFEKEKLGVVKKVKARVYFPRSEFHCRYPSLFAMDDVVRWSTYHRSNFKKLEGKTQKDFKFQGNQEAVTNGMYAKTGNYYNPFYFENYKKALKPCKTKKATKASGWYDALLNRQKEMAAYVVENVKKKDSKFSINSDNGYTCVLFSLPKPENEKNPKIWSQFLSVYLIALTNKLAYERGINIEMVQRSSFGCLRPSVADCGESIRVNLGLTPKPYADCVIDAIFYLQQIVSKQKAFEIPMASPNLANTLTRYNKKNTTKNKTVNVALEKTLWDTLWAPGDSSNKSFASQMFRKSVVSECFIDLVQDGCHKKTLKDLFEDDKAFKEAFVAPVVKILDAIKLEDNSLSIQMDETSLKTYQWKTAKPVQDDEFWELTTRLAKRVGVLASDLRCLNAKKTQDLHSRFEAWLCDFTFKPVADDTVVDGLGSESEEEGELEINNESTTVYAKKIITATGMRAIQLSYAACVKYLHDNYQVDPLSLSISATQMYYETEDALLKHPIPVALKHENYKKIGQKNIGFFDVNHCNTTHEVCKETLSFIGKQDKICVIDVTSATTTEIHDTLVQLFEKRPTLEMIMTVGSGLKNEQAMGDYNPYGTVRLFSKTTQVLEKVYADIVDLEKKAGYVHPKESHLIRKTAKTCGMTPTNSAILG